MPRGRALLVLLPACLLAALALALLASPARAVPQPNTETCDVPWDCSWNLQPTEADSKDTWIDESNPDRNYDTGSNSEQLVVQAPDGARAWTLIAFPLGALPRNISVHSAEMDFQAASTGSTTAQRTLRMYEIVDPWDEGAVNWTTGHLLDLAPSAIENVSTSPDSGSPLGGGVGGGIKFGGPSEDPSTGLTASITKFYRGEAPYHGYLIRDEGNSVGNLPQTQRYQSSSDINKADQRPRLIIEFDPDAPEIRQLRVDGQTFANATSTRPVNLTFTSFDPKGNIVDAWVNATDQFGHEYFNRSVFANHTTQNFGVDYLSFWSNESLNLTPGNYILNALVLDNDGNINYTTWRQYNLTVENTPPWVNQSKDPSGTPIPFVSADHLDERQALHAAVNASDHSGIAGVSLQVQRGNDTLANLSFQAVAGHVDANASGDWALDAEADWAGQLNLTIWVQDRAGNLNFTGPFALRVRHIFPPVIVDASVRGAGTTAEGAVQEQGGSVRWTAHVTDAAPFALTLYISPPGGAPEQAVPMALGPDGAYAYQANFTDRGSYGGRIVALDEDGNRAERDGLGFLLVPAAPPVIDDLRPGPSAWGPAVPLIQANVSDLNLDPSSITLETRVLDAQGAQEPFTLQEARIVQTGDTSRAVSFSDRFFHGEVVEVRVRASDSFGRASEQVWNFTVDARPPLTVLTPMGPSLAGERTKITGRTGLRLDRSDEGSGVLATSFAVINEDAHLETGNITILGSGPATVNLSASGVFTGTGNYTLFYATVDVAGNVEPVQSRRLYVDDTAPVVDASFEPGLIHARVVEVGVGLRSVRATYALAPGGQQGTVDMSPTADPLAWEARIPDGARGTRVLYSVRAEDLLGNVGSDGTDAQPLSAFIQNHKPVIALEPGNNSLVRGSVAISWDVTDKDGDAVRVSLAARPSTVAKPRDLAPLRGPQGTFTWDTTGVGDGLWVVTLTAADPYDAVAQSVWMDVTNTGSKIVRLDAPGGEPMQPMVVAATIYEPVRQATAILKLDGQEVARAVLHDDGAAPDREAADGVFSGQFLPSREGHYSVDLQVLFTDGRSESLQDVPVAVQWAYPGRIVHDPLLLVLVVGAPAAIVGVWAYRRWGPIRPARAAPRRKA